MANIIANPYEEEAKQIERKRAFAEALRQQGMQQRAPRMVGGVRQQSSVLDGLNQMLQAYSGRQGMEQADQATKDLQTRKQQALADYLGQMPKDQTTTTQQLVGDRPGAGEFQDVTTTKKATPDDYMKWLMQGTQIGPEATQLAQLGYQHAVHSQDRADDQTWKATQAKEARESRIAELQLRLMDARTAREDKADLMRELAQLKANAGASGGTPYFQAVSTPQGVMAFNARTGRMEPVQVNGTPVMKAEHDPALQGTISGAKEAGKDRAKNAVAAQAALPQDLAQADQTIGLVDELLKHPGLDKAVGFSSLNPLNKIPGTDAKAFNVRLDQLKGQQFMQAYQSLRGGGQITEVEGKKATDAISRMDTATSKEEFVKAAKEFQAVIRAGVGRAKAKAGGVTPGASGGWDEKQPAGPSIDDILNKY